MPSEAFNPYYKWLGIPPSEQPANHYRLLGISPFESDPEVIDRAADSRMGFLRQNQGGPNGPWSQKLLNEVAAARVCLLTAAAKARYDAELRAALNHQKAMSSMIPQTVASPVLPEAGRTAQWRGEEDPLAPKTKPATFQGVMVALIVGGTIAVCAVLAVGILLLVEMAKPTTNEPSLASAAVGAEAQKSTSLPPAPVRGSEETSASTVDATPTGAGKAGDQRAEIEARDTATSAAAAPAEGRAGSASAVESASSKPNVNSPAASPLFAAQQQPAKNPAVASPAAPQQPAGGSPLAPGTGQQTYAPFAQGASGQPGTGPMPGGPARFPGQGGFPGQPGMPSANAMPRMPPGVPPMMPPFGPPPGFMPPGFLPPGSAPPNFAPPNTAPPGSAPPNSAPRQASTRTAEEPSVRVKSLDDAIKILKTPDAKSSERSGALNALKVLPVDAQRRAEVAGLLEPLLTSTSRSTQEAALNLMDTWGTPANIPTLIKLLSAQSFSVRQAAIRGLGALGGKDKDAAKAVAELLAKDNDRYHAQNALEKMGPIAEEYVWPYVDSGDTGLRFTACGILGKIGTSKTLVKLKAIRPRAQSKYEIDSAIKELEQRLVKR